MCIAVLNLQISYIYYLKLIVESCNFLIRKKMLLLSLYLLAKYIIAHSNDVSMSTNEDLTEENLNESCTSLPNSVKENESENKYVQKYY